jgi:hypothetical protein
VSGVSGDRTELLVDYKRRMLGGEDLDARLRAAMFAHLFRVTATHPDGVPSHVINSFTFDGSPMRLLVQPSIRKPAQIDAARPPAADRTQTPPPWADTSPRQVSVTRSPGPLHRWYRARRAPFGSSLHQLAAVPAVVQ